MNTKTINIILWIAQVLLGAMFIMIGILKTTSPIDDLVAQGMDYGIGLTRFIGVSELLGGIGLILPSVLRIKPNLTVWAARGIMLIMLLAVGYHLFTSDYVGSVMPLVLGLIAFFVAWGRSKKVPILPK